MSNTYKSDIDLVQIPAMILDSIPSGIIFCDSENKIRFINRTYAEYLEVSQQEVIGKNIKDYIPGTRINHVMATGKPELGFKCSVGEGKEKKILIVNRIPVTGDNDSVIGVISQSLFGDIGELRDLSTRMDHLEKKISSYREKIQSVLSPKYCLDDIKGDSSSITAAKRLAEKYARTDSSVLLEGPTGAGKELFAHSLHAVSRRSNGPFVSINCAAIPHDLLESELFGYAPGAFTGAHKKGKLGKIELADRGTLFLDEIGDMPLSAQAKLLRILEDRLVYKLGSNHPTKVTFRLIAATNRGLKSMISEKKFRQDLYYRLNTMIIQIPPLTERKNDIPCLVSHFLEMSDKSHVSYTSEAMAALKRYNWPGNVRELKSAVECAVSLIGPDSCTIEVADLPADIVSLHSSVPFDRVNICKPRTSTLVESERMLIRNSLTENNWNMAKTARQLGISRAALYEKTKKFKLFRPKS